MEERFSNQMELEEGELVEQSWECRSDDPNHGQKTAIDINKDGKEIIDHTIQGGESAQQNLKESFGYADCTSKDAYNLSKSGNETATPNIREVAPQRQSIKRACGDSNHSQKDAILRKERNKSEHAIMREDVQPHQSWKRRRYDDLDHIQRDASKHRKAREATAEYTFSQGRSSEKIGIKQSFNDSAVRRKDANDLNKDGYATRNMRGTLKETKQSFNDSAVRRKDANGLNKDGYETRNMHGTLKDWISSTAEEHPIVWPPVVIIENIRTGFDKNTKLWDGLKNNEIKSWLKLIKDLEYKKVSAIYNRFGHCGTAVVVFEANDSGYMNADTLSQCLQRAGRGREDWDRVRPRSSLVNEHDMEQLNRKGLVEDDGKRTIYGYLAKPSDMNRIKPSISKLSIESYMKKVLEPMKRRHKENERVCKEIQVLEEEAEQKTQALEVEKLEFNQVAEELQKKNDEVQLYKQQEEEAKHVHKDKMEENKRKYEMEKHIKWYQYQQRESEIRAKISANEQQFEKETEEYMRAEHELEQGIQKEKKEQELRLAEIRGSIAMRQVRLDKELAAKMEKKFAELEERLNKKKLELQAKHHQEILQFKEKCQKERQEMLQKKLLEQRELEKEVETAKAETEKLANATKAETEQATRCVKCDRDFGPKLARALYEDCGHKDICMACAKKHWQKNKGKCPICNQKQAKKFVIVPFRIYC